MMHAKIPALRNYGRYLVLLQVVLFIFVLGGGCTQQSLEPVSPVWDTDITLPLTNRTYTLADIVAKNPGSLHAGAGNQIIYSSTSETSPTTIGDLLTLSPDPSTDRFKLGAFSVMFLPMTVQVPLPWLPQGAIVQIPDTTVPMADQTTSVGTFQNITISSGTATLTLRNHLPVPVRVVNPVSLVSNSSTVAVFQFTAPAIIQPNDSLKSTSDLAGKTVESVVGISGLVLEVFASPQPVQIPFGPAFEVTIAANNLAVSRATSAVIPPQQLTNNDTTNLSLDDSTIVSYARLDRGSVNLAIANHIPLNILFKYRFADVWHVVRGVTVPFEDSISIPAGATLLKTADLSRCEIHSQPAGALVESLKTVSSVIIPGTAYNVTVSDTDRVVVTMTQATPIVADTVAGVIKPTTVNVNRSFALNLGDFTSNFSGQLSIPLASLGLNIVSTIGSPMDLSLRLVARSASGGQTAVLPVPQMRVNAGTTPVVFDSSDVGRFLSSLSGTLPDSIQLLGSVLVNPQYDRSPAGIRHLGRNSSVAGDARLDIPLKLRIVGTATYADTISLNDPENSGYRDFVDQAKTDKLTSGSVFMEISNGTPVQVDVSFRWLDAAHALLLRLPQNGDTVHVSAAAVDANGSVSVPAQSTSVIRLTGDQAKEFSNASYFSKSIALMTTQGSAAVKFRTTDFITVRAWSSFTTRVGN